MKIDEHHTAQTKSSNAFTDLDRDECANAVGGSDILRRMATIAHHQAQQSSSGHQIDLSVCAPATFDFKKCLG